MKSRCKNGIDFDECDNEASNGYDGYCELCAEKRFDDYNESLMQGYVIDINKQIEDAKAYK